VFICHDLGGLILKSVRLQRSKPNITTAIYEKFGGRTRVGVSNFN
jgi:hypothetical protein